MIDLSSLNDKQIEAVKYDDGPLLVLAGAGSGKTRVITYKISYLIDNGIDYKSILAMTFTNKAAEEMKERVSKLINDDSKNIFISTFHKFCGRVLRNFIDKLGYTNSFTIYDTLDQKKLIANIIKDFEFENLKEKSVARVISNCKCHNISPEDYEKEAYSDNEKNTSKCFYEYQKRMFKLNAIDFDDMLILTVKLLKEHKDVKEYINNRFKYLLVDEYQDTNSIQFELIKLLSPNGEHLTVVGDDDQSIYKFRGAEIANILDFESNFKNTKVIKLTQNYRSTNNILYLANSVIKHNFNRMGKELWSENGDGDKPVYNRYDDDRTESLKVIKNIIDRADIKNTAVLYRRNAQSRNLEESCRQFNIPYVIIGDVGFYERKEIKDILAYLHVVANQNDNISLFRAINTPRRGVGDSSISKLIQYSNDNNISVYESLKFAKEVGLKGKALDGINKFIYLIEEIKNKTEIEHMIDMILEIGEYQNYLIDEYGKVEADDRLNNIKELKNNAVSFKFKAMNNNDYDDELFRDYKENLSGVELLNEFLNDLALISSTDNLDDTKDKLTLMTLHSSKGLEYNNIYIVGINENNSPSQMSLGSEDDIEEERRLCYVGITRAKKHLYLSSYKYGFYNGQQMLFDESRFISEMDDTYLDKKDSSTNAGIDIFSTDRSYKKRNNNYNDYVLKPAKKVVTTNTENLYKLGKSIKKSDKLEYGVGDRVTHIKYGDGVVKNIVDQPADFEVTVDFDDFGEKSFYATFAKLTKI